MPVTTIAEFEIALDTYGAAIHLWPIELRGQAMSLLARSADARALLETAQRMDATLRSASEQKAPRGLSDRIIDRALKSRRGPASGSE
jgi:hypothetical protein